MKIKSGHTSLVHFCIKTTLYALDNNVLAAYKNIYYIYIYMYKRVDGRRGGLTFGYYSGLQIGRPKFEPWLGHCGLLAMDQHAYPRGVAILLVASYN